ncbi:hypothetical protein, partial [Chitinophaga sp.]|uniref:hypothetical protein n=1 Tax=Chitinophaga sp. TaxID=1869181 RepID=UPI002F9489A7
GGVFVSGCSGVGPQVNDKYTVFTPEFADNRVYYLGAKQAGKNQPLESVGLNSEKNKNEIVRNSPISIILRSVEIPAKYESDGKGGLKKGVITESADYAVILDVGIKADGSANSLVVWYQRGVQPDQSLNFSNLLVYYEPRWDERVAPFFRVRVMNVTKEKNEETRRALERAHNVAGTIGVMAKNPIVTPLIGISFTAAELVFANKENKMLLDYSVQLYSSSAAEQAGMELGTLKRGSYVVVGRPPAESRTFWKGPFTYDPESRLVFRGADMINVPTASLTVGTFESIVPVSVVDRSTTLTALLSSSGSGTTVEEIQDVNNRLSASIEAFTAAEKIRRYRNHMDVQNILVKMNMDRVFQSRLGSEDVFFVLRAASECFGVTPFASIKEAYDYRAAHENERCKGEAS